MANRLRRAVDLAGARCSPAAWHFENFVLGHAARRAPFACAFAMVGAVPILMPVFRFRVAPRPMRLHATKHRVNASRADIFTADPNARRELMEQAT